MNRSVALTLLPTVGLIFAGTALVLRGEPARSARVDRGFQAIRGLQEASTREPILPIPDLDDQDPARVQLGRRLFHDARLSSDGSVSCASCHDLAADGVDGLPLSVGVQGRRGDRNAPTVFNSRFNTRQFWDGRAKSLEEQVQGPLLSANEMDMTWEDILALLRSDPDYVRGFQEAFGSAPDTDGVRAAIAAFERSLVTPNSPFDRFLQGDEEAIPEAARRGYELFQDVGCITCHQGVNVGGNMMQRLGRVHAYGQEQGQEPAQRSAEGDDLLRVPPLRNAVSTAPYFHDGSIPTLEEAIRVMARHQLGVELSEEEVSDIASFLATLRAPLDERKGGGS